jgi:transposase-like protein
MAKSKTSKRYTPQFKRQMVELHRAGRGIAELAREFGSDTLDDRTVGQASRSGCWHGDGGLTTNERGADASAP